MIWLLWVHFQVKFHATPHTHHNTHPRELQSEMRILIYRHRIDTKLTINLLVSIFYARYNTETYIICMYFKNYRQNPQKRHGGIIPYSKVKSVLHSSSSRHWMHIKLHINLFVSIFYAGYNPENQVLDLNFENYVYNTDGPKIKCIFLVFSTRKV